MTLQVHTAGVDDDVDALSPWFHNLHLPNGVQTAPDHPLGDLPAFKWAPIAAEPTTCPAAERSTSAAPGVTTPSSSPGAAPTSSMSTATPTTSARPTGPDGSSASRMAFVEHHLAGDHTIWWVPSRGAIEAIVPTTGLVVTARPDDEVWICRRERESIHREQLRRAHTDRAADDGAAA